MGVSMTIRENREKNERAIRRFYAENGVTPESRRECFRRLVFGPLWILLMPVTIVIDIILVIGLIDNLIRLLF